MLPEYQDAILFAATPGGFCVGIKIFPKSTLFTASEMDTEQQSIANAIALKDAIECGSCDIANNDQIILNPCITTAYAESTVRNQLHQSKCLLRLKHENLLLTLGRAIVKSAHRRNFEYDILTTCLSEICCLAKNVLTPLMLKKNPKIVHIVAKLCQYVNKKTSKTEEQSERTRQFAKRTLRSLQVLMNFSGQNHQFLRWFDESVSLFNELTANYTDQERRQLTIDPELAFRNQINL